MPEVNKKLRLPGRVQSWFALLQKVPFQDQLSSYEGTGNPVITFEGWDGPNIHERSEYRMLDVKARAFDELRDILPDNPRALFSIYSHIKRSHATGEGPEFDLLEKLIELYQ